MSEPVRDAERLRALFDAAWDLAGDERRACLDEACAGDAVLRAEIEALLGAAARDDSFLATPSRTLPALAPCIAGASAGVSAGDDVGAQIGPYRLLERIGEGGFGRVYRAAQEEPIQRTVALKILKSGMDSAQVIARFEAERQTLARMDHPGIARVLDAGTTEQGPPYFAMELVEGRSITEHCDAERATIEARLRLFLEVCEAVRHAHQKGIIHRDLKPSNVLVDRRGEQPRVKVIDFGIAKAADHAALQRAAFTEQHQILGTPEYMSPEQAAGVADIDTRTDVYSLGVLLYELLAGVPPFEPQRLRRAAYDEMLRMIREEDPPPPSTRVAALGEKAATVATSRSTAVHRLRPLLRGELDWIVMRAMEKDRERRYGGALAFAEDVARFLGGEPIIAAPPSALYRLRKLVRRHRVAAFSAAALLLILCASIAAIGAALVRALDAESQQTVLRSAAEQEATAARRAQKRAELIGGFLQDLLESAGPKIAKGRDIALLREVMDAAAARIEQGELREFPEAEVTLRSTIGEIYRAIGEERSSARILDRVVEIGEAAAQVSGDSKYRALAWTSEAVLLSSSGDPAAAEPIFEDLYLLQRERLPPGHSEVARAAKNLAMSRSALGRNAEAQALIDAAVEAHRAAGGRELELASALVARASIRMEAGDLEAAREDLLEAREIYIREDVGEHPDLARSTITLGSVLAKLSRFEEAETLLREGLASRERLYPPAHPEVISALGSLAMLLRDRGRTPEAKTLASQAVERGRITFPEGSPLLARQLALLATIEQRSGDLGEADRLFSEALQIYRGRFEGDHPEIANNLNNLAIVRFVLGRVDEAEDLAEESVAMRRRIEPGDHGHIALLFNTLGGIRRHLGRLREAEESYRAALEMNRRLFERTHPQLLASELQLASILTEAGEPEQIDEATRALRAFLAQNDPALGEHERQGWLLAHAQSLLAGALTRRAGSAGLDEVERARLYAEAEPLAVGAWQSLERDRRVPSAAAFGMDRRRDALERVARLFDGWAGASGGDELRARAETWRAALSAYDAQHAAPKKN